MSQENVELVRSIYEAFNRRDWDGVFGLTIPEFEFTLKRGPDAGTHRGRDEVRQVLEDQASAFVRFRLQPKGSDAEFEIRIGTLWTIRDGKLLSAEGFPEREKALEAAGLSD